MQIINVLDDLTIGVSMMWAKIGSIAKPTVHISIDGETWTLKSETTMKTTTISFKLGEEFDETTADDRKMKVYIFHHFPSSPFHSTRALCTH